MRYWWSVPVVLVGLSLSGFAQQNSTFRVKRSAPEKAPKRSATIGKTAASPAAASTANSRDLQTLERQTAKSSAPSRPAANRTPRTGSALKPVKDKPNPPINFGETGGKSVGTTSQGKNPYKGRLRQKHAHQ